MAEVTASGATAAARMTFDKTIKVVVEVLVPVGAAVAGFFMPSILGGGNAVAGIMYRTVTPQGATGNRVGWGFQAIINGMVGGAFWTLRRMDGLIAKTIGGAVGGFFLGGAVGCLPGLLTGNAAPPNGLIDHLATSIEGVAQGG
jgi:hypothetical protein